MIAAWLVALVFGLGANYGAAVGTTPYTDQHNQQPK